MTDSDSDEAFEAFTDHMSDVVALRDTKKVLDWDRQVTMPNGGTPARSRQLSSLEAAIHSRLTDDRVGDWLATLDGTDLDDERRATVREVRREHERLRDVPRDLIERHSTATTEALPVWEEAKEQGEFEQFEDSLAEIVSLNRELAEAIDPDRDPYAVLLAEHEPCLALETVDRVLESLRKGLVPLLEEIRESDATLADPFEGRYETTDQAALSEAVLSDLGYDWDRGMLDTGPHPFSIGTQFDARIVTRYDPEDPLDPFYSTIHEFGHANYTLGLPQETYGSMLATHRGMVIHESQSRLWENQVGRSRPFWDYAAGRLAEHIGVDADPSTLYEAANRVDPDNPIRVEADELSYHLHIVLRYEIERDLVRGDLDVSEVPAVWNEKMRSYLDVDPADDGEGCLQDIHWSHGYFGYFPTYSLGSVLAAQLFATVEGDIDDLEAQIRAGEFGPLRDWLREEVHRHGSRYTTNELIERATGSSLTAEPFLSTLESKYGSLYDL